MLPEVRLGLIYSHEGREAYYPFGGPETCVVDNSSILKRVPNFLRLVLVQQIIYSFCTLEAANQP